MPCPGLDCTVLRFLGFIWLVADDPHEAGRLRPVLREVPVHTHWNESDALLTPAEVAAILYVDPKTVTRWARAGKLNFVLTPGGHRRFLESEIVAMITGVNHGSDQREMIEHDVRQEGGTTGSDQVAAAAAVVAEAVAIALEAQADDAAEAGDLDRRGGGRGRAKSCPGCRKSS
jgi:excisionase family DNA binding protein